MYFPNSVVCLSPEILSISLSSLITSESLGFICIFIASITVAVWPFLRSGSEPRGFNLAQLSQQQNLKPFEPSLLRKQYYIFFYIHKTIILIKYWIHKINEVKNQTNQTYKMTEIGCGHSCHHCEYPLTTDYLAWKLSNSCYWTLFYFYFYFYLLFLENVKRPFCQNANSCSRELWGFWQKLDKKNS